MASPARDFVGHQTAPWAVSFNLASGSQTNIYFNSVTIERPVQPAPPQWGVWVPSGGVPDFVRTLFQNILNRDPESQDVLEYHTRNTYQNGLGNTVGGFINSNEYTGRGLSAEATVDRLYLSVLGREAEAVARAHHVQTIQNGMTLWRVAENFVGSEEYRERVRAGKAPHPIHWPHV